MTRARTLRLGVAAGVVALLVVGVTAGMRLVDDRGCWWSDIFCRDLGEFNSERFDRTVWRRHPWPRYSGDQNPRGRMVDDLLTNRLRVGLTQRRVLSLLGPPDDRYEPEQGGGIGWSVGRYQDCIHQVVVVEFEDGRLERASLLWPRDTC